MLTCSDVAGPSSSGSGDLFELSDGLNTTCTLLLFPPLLPPLATILDLSVTTTTELLLRRDTSSCIGSIRTVLR